MTSAGSNALQPPRSVGLALIIAGALAIGIATLTPAPEPADPLILPPFSCFICGDLGGTDIALNLMLFAPFAIGLALSGLRPWRVLLVASLLSLTIEALQIKVIPGRDASVSDLVTNSGGAFLAAWLVHWRVALLLPEMRRARWLTLVGLAAWSALQVSVAWSLQPSLPRTDYWGQWAPDLGFLDRFRGTVHGATVAGDSLPPHQLTDSDSLRRALLGGQAMVAATATTGEAPEDLAPIVSVFDRHYREIFLLGQRGDAAFFRFRTRVSLIKFRPPAISIAHAIPVTAGEPVVLTAGYLKGRYSLRVEAEGKTTERTLDASPNWAWSYFLPWQNYAFGTDVRWLTALWAGGLLFPIGFWAGRSGSRAMAQAPWVVVGVTLYLVARLFSLPATHLSEWGASGLGLILGHASARWSMSKWPAGKQPA